MRKVRIVAALATAAGLIVSSHAFADGNGDGSKYKVTIDNGSDFPLWITYYKSNARAVGQAGTQCIPAHTKNFFAWSSWQYSTSIRVEVKSNSSKGKDCSGSSPKDTDLVNNWVPNTAGSASISVRNGNDWIDWTVRN